MRNRIFGWIMTVGFVAGGGEVAAQEPLRQGPQESVVLRFDEARRDTLADVPSATAETLPAAAGRPFAYKLNHRRVTREEAYGRVTLWNVRRVRVKNRRMRLADTTRRERVRLLKFFIERDRRKAEAAGEEWVEPKKENPFAYKLPLTGEINPENNLTVDFDYPLTRLDSAAMLLTLTRSDNSIEDVPVRFVRDTGLLRRWHIEAPWTSGGQYTLTIPKGAITDVAGFSNDSIVRKYTVLDPEKFATVKIHVKGKDDKAKYILQLLDGSNALKQEKRDVTTGDWQFNYVPAGEIKFRIIEDMNGNGKWDTGNVVERLQPERAEIYANDEGEDTFATKTNWEVEFSIDMNRVFAPVTMESLSRLLDEREAQRLRREAEKRAKEPKTNRNSHDQNNQNNANGFGSFGGFGGGMNNSMNSTGGMFNR